MSYTFLLSLHSLTRWLLVLSLLWALFLAAKGYFGTGTFGRKEQISRIFMISIVHLQAAIGYTLYFISPVVKYFLKNAATTMTDLNISFFGIIHILLMTIAVVIATIGSAKVKRAITDRDKFKTLLVYCGITFIIIFIAVPWPFSPLAHRAFWRPF